MGRTVCAVHTKCPVSGMVLPSGPLPATAFGNYEFGQESFSHVSYINRNMQQIQY